MTTKLKIKRSTQDDTVASPKRKRTPVTKKEDVKKETPVALFHSVSSKANTTAEAINETSILRPGPTLQRCSGSDVQLSRGACNPLNLTKCKGRFLVILPGMLSLKQHQKITKDLQEQSESTENSETPQPIKESVATPQNLHLGKLTDLNTDSPSLRIPLNDSQELVFKGSKVQCTSKFMALTCAPKGSITCKAIFSSVVVFGESSIQNNGTNAATTESIPNTKLTHFGGSTRAINSGKPLRNPIPVSPVPSKKTCADPSVMDVESVQEEESDQEEIAISGDSGDEFLVRNMPQADSVVKRSPRRGAVTSSVSYKDLEDTGDEKSEGSDSDNSVEEEDNSQHSAPSTSVLESDNSEASDASPLKKRRKSAVKPIRSATKNGNKNTPQKKSNTPQKKSNTPQKKSNTESAPAKESEDELDDVGRTENSICALDDTGDEKSDEGPKTPTNSAKRRPAKSRAVTKPLPKKKNQKIILVDSEDDKVKQPSSRKRNSNNQKSLVEEEDNDDISVDSAVLKKTSRSKSSRGASVTSKGAGGESSIKDDETSVELATTTRTSRRKSSGAVVVNYKDEVESEEEVESEWSD